MKKIAIIRGADLGEYEMQNYEPLVGGGIELVGFTSTKPRGRISKIKFPVRQLYMLADFSKASKYQAALNRFFGDGQVMVGLEKALEGFDIAHSAETFNYYTYQAVKAKLAGKVEKVVVTVWQNMPLTGEFNPVQKAFKKEVLNNVDLFHAVTEQAKEALLIDGVEEQKIKVLPYGVNLDVFKPNADISPGDFIILSIGRLVWEKGFDYLIIAFKKLLLQPRLAGQRPKLLIVGEGPREGILKQIVTRLGLEEQVVFVGKVPYEEMPALHSSASVFVLPSLPLENWQEQFGMVLIESMASGKPVIVGMSGALPEVVGGAGILVPPGDADSIAEAIGKLVVEEDFRKMFGEKSLARAKDMFDAKKVADELKNFYMSL